jgi:ABC-type branched-subunit amino acid transport system ATPase component
MTPALEVENLSVSYGRVPVLFDLDLRVEAGETLAVLGSNGAGKSTLLKAISGLLPVDSGAVRLHGTDVTSAPTEGRLGHGLVHLVGGNATFGPLRVEENLHAATHTYTPAERDRRVSESFDRFPSLRELRNQSAASLSGGQEQLLALAMALVHEPRILMIDELSLGLAPVVVQEVLEIMGQLRSNGTTVVVVEQSLSVALSLAQRAVFIERGRIHYEGPTEELLERDDLARAIFLGR